MFAAAGNYCRDIYILNKDSLYRPKDNVSSRYYTPIIQ